MKHTIKIVILSLCAALALSACNKRHHTPDTSDQKIPLSFTAESHDAATKAVFPSTYDFGVYGIATKALHEDYILWTANESDHLERVTKSTTTGNYVTQNEAYWLSGYEYNFVALAPFSSAEVLDLGTVSSTDKTPNIRFTYEMGNRCDDAGFMIAVAHNEYNTGDSTTQSLIFWHFYSKININVIFVDAERRPVENENNVVTGMRLCNVATKGQYTVTCDESNIPVLSEGVIDPTTADFSFTSGTETVHIIPQDISDLEMYIDFSMVTDAGVGSSNNFKLNLNFPQDQRYYDYNEVYNWNITIGPKEAIGFNVTVNKWEDADDFEFPIE